MNPVALLDEFRAEAGEHLRRIESLLLQMEQDPQTPSALRDMFRSAHTIKGGAALVGIGDVLELAHAVEDVLARLRDSGEAIDTTTSNLLFDAIDALRDGAANSLPGHPHQSAPRERLLSRLREWGGGGSRLGVGADAPPDASTRRALVVDNSSTVRLLSTMLLTDSGFTVDAVADARQALADARTLVYDLVVTAIETAGLGGLELVAALRATPACQGLPIIVTSTNDNPEHRRRAEELGVLAYLPKGSLGDRRLAQLAGSLVPRKQPPVVARRVLVVDDSSLHQRVTRQQVETLGYAAGAVSSGREALEALEHGEYAAVLMDCQLPDLDGFETTRAIRAGSGAARNVPIIATSADTTADDRARCAAAGMDDFLPKPLQLDDLAARLARWARPRPTRQAAVDLEVLEGLRALRQPGRPDPVGPLIQVFVGEARMRLDDCRTAMGQSDAPGVRASAHALKGASGTFGATRLQALSGSLEQSAERGALTEAEPLLPQIEQELQLVVDMLEAFASDAGQAQDRSAGTASACEPAG